MIHVIKKNRMKKVIVFLIACIFIATSISYAEHLKIGTTYSQKQSEYLSQDWKKVYASILEIGFDVLRLGAYWDEIEKKEGIYDFDNLDWQIEQAKKKSISVLLTVGMKAPRWPEYHIPAWVLRNAKLSAGQDVSRDNYLKEKTLKFVKTVVERYDNESIIKWWQVENEPLDRSGPKHWWIGRNFLKEEVELVRSIDTKKRPIVINLATYPNKVLHVIARLSSPTYPVTNALPLCDILGINIYPTVGHKLWNLKLYFWSKPGERMKCYSSVINKAHRAGKKVWVTELQAEPWEPGELVHKAEENPKTASTDMILTAFNELQSLGIDAVLLWGVEYWCYRQERYEDSSWWRKAINLIKSKRTQNNKALSSDER